MDQQTLVLAQFWSVLVQAGASLLLVFVTVWYVFLTNRISRFSKDTVEAARKSAEVSDRALVEMRQQRLSSSQPLVIGRIESHRNYAGTPESIQLILSNVGNGPALTTQAQIQLRDTVYKVGTQTVLPLTVIREGKDSERLQFIAPRDSLQHRAEPLYGRILITYRDIYGREFHVTIGLELTSRGDLLNPNGQMDIRILEHAGESRTLLGAATDLSREQ